MAAKIWEKERMEKGEEKKKQAMNVVSKFDCYFVSISSFLHAERGVEREKEKSQHEQATNRPIL